MKKRFHTPAAWVLVSKHKDHGVVCKQTSLAGGRQVVDDPSRLPSRHGAKSRPCCLTHLQRRWEPENGTYPRHPKEAVGPEENKNRFNDIYEVEAVGPLLFLHDFGDGLK